MRNYFLFLIGLVSCFVMNLTFACGLIDVPLKFYSHHLGSYNISLTDTLTAIADKQADQNGNVKPYYKRPWLRKCPKHIGSYGSCIEFTVYPIMHKNFVSVTYHKAPKNNIMWCIEKYNGGNPNRGEVRIITDSSESQYVYTTDHEKIFCGPYPVS